jgi:L-2-hydroxyglutarate oxidase LhgO
MSSRFVITCAGLHSDRVAAYTGDADGTRIVPFRGDYYTFAPAAAGLVRGLIYPVPDPRYPFLGVHFTRTVHDEVHAGPNAVLAFAREGYRVRDVSARDLAEMLRFAGFRKLVRAHARTGVTEFRRDLSKRVFLASLRRYIPALRASDLVFGPSGVRAQAVDSGGRLLDDFDFGGNDRVLHVRNAPSPAATASLAIGRHLVDEAEKRFGLAAG